MREIVVRLEYSLFRSATVLRSALGAPGLALAIAAYGVAALTALVLWSALQMPVLGARFVPKGDQVAVIAADGTRLASLPANAPIRIVAPGVSVSGAAETFVQDFVPDPAKTDLVAWYADRTTLAALSGAAIRIELPDSRSITLTPAPPRTLANLSIDVWMLLGGGAIVVLLGVWVCSLRATDWGAQMFFLASAGIGLSAFSGAVYDARELTADGRLLWTMITLNCVGTSLGTGATVAQFMLFPRRMVTPWAVAPMILFELAWGLAGGVGWVPLGVYYAGLLIHLPVLAIAMVLQWRRSRGDPGDRAILRWIGATTGVGAGVLLAGMAAPQLSDIPPLASDGFAFVPLLAIYGGMGLAVGRLKLFDLDQWAYRLILTAFVILSFLAIDAALALALHLAEPLAFSLAVVGVAVGYLPLRALMWRRVLGGPRLDQAALFEGAAKVAFQADAEQRRADWWRLLEDIFEPLEIALSSEGHLRPQLSPDRFELHIPPAATEQALRLRLPHRGRRLFNKTDLRLAEQMTDLLARAEVARDGYAKGVREERARIARDLHDDVGARLLTSLHRQALGDIRQDVRQAMGDIRLIFSGLAGDQVDLSQLLADLRHETSERLAAAGVTLGWALPLEEPAPRTLPYEIYKALISAMREAVTNSLKHAAPTRLTVDIQNLDGLLRVEICDDGAGASTSPTQAGNGLRNIRERLALIGGTFSFACGPQGSRAILAIPLTPLAGAPPVSGDDSPGATA